MIFNPLMKGEPLLEARESKDSKGTHVLVQNFYSWVPGCSSTLQEEM
jgi:hypothetical protein